MRLLRFTFKNEAVWMMIFSFGLPVVGFLIGFLILLIAWLVRR